MALFLDSFDYYTDPTVNYFVDIVGMTSSAVRIVAGQGVNGTSALSIASVTGNSISMSNGAATVPSGLGAAVYRRVSALNTAAVSAAINIPSGQSPTASTRVFALIQNNQVQADLAITAAGQIEIRSGGSLYRDPTVLVVGPAVLYDAYYTYEMVVVTAASGSVLLNVYDSGGNLITTLTASGVNTAPSGTALTDSVQWGHTGPILGSGSTLAYYLDDVSYAIPPTTPLLGSYHVTAYLPTGNGDSTQWTPVGAGTNYQAVNKNPATPATVYNRSVTPGNLDLYSFTITQPAGTPNIIGAQVLVLSQGSGVLHIAAKSGSIDAESADISVPSAGPTYQSTMFFTDPATGQAWTWASIVNAQFGMKDISNVASPEFQIQLRPRGVDSYFPGGTGGVVLNGQNAIDADTNPPTTFATVTSQHGDFAGGDTTMFVWGFPIVANQAFIDLGALFPNGSTGNAWAAMPFAGSGQGHPGIHLISHSFPFDAELVPSSGPFSLLEGFVYLDSSPKVQVIPQLYYHAEINPEIHASGYDELDVYDLFYNAPYFVPTDQEVSQVVLQIVIQIAPPTPPPPFECPEWLRRFPDSMLLDIAANDAIFPLAIRQCAQDFWNTRRIYIPSRSIKISAYQPIREHEQALPTKGPVSATLPGYPPIVAQEVDLGEDEAPQLPVVSPTLI